MKPSTGLILASLAFLLCSGHAACAEYCPSVQASYLELSSPQGEADGPMVGQGEYRYRLVVRDPTRIGRPFRHGRYQIELKEGATFPDGTPFFRGVADARGRTAIFRFERPIPAPAWFVQPLVGRGEYGESFRLTAGDGCGAGMAAGMPYVIDEELGPIFCGETLPDGMTIRYMTQHPAHLALYDSYTSNECRRLQRVLNPVMARPSPRRRLAGLHALKLAPRFRRYLDIVQAKIDAQILHYGSIKELEALVERLREQEAAGDEGTALNNVAYLLMQQHPPRFPDFADALLDRSLAHKETLFNTDSKAWSLHLRGRDVEALQWIDRSLAHFGNVCKDSERNALQEALAHRGAIRWALKQRLEALDDWAKASTLGSGGGWTNVLPRWSLIGPFVEARLVELREQGAMALPCGATAEVPVELTQPEDDIGEE